MDHIVPKNQCGSGRYHQPAGCMVCALENELALCIAVADLVIQGQVMSFQSWAPRAMGSCQVQR